VSILEQAFLSGARDVGFYATGEPFMYKDINFAVNTAKKIGYAYVYITTNGALAMPQKVKKLIEAGLDSIKFSINAASRETYRIIHGRDDYEVVLENLRFIRNYRDANDIPLRIGVTYVITDANRVEIQQAKGVFGELADDVGFFEEGNQGGYMSENGKPSNVHLPCSLLFNRFHVSYEGYFSLCCVDYQNYLAVADLKKMSLNEAWSSPLAVKMRKRHLASNVKGTLCHNCVECKSDPIEPLVPEYATIFN
jgi:hypothetical protein